MGRPYAIGALGAEGIVTASGCRGWRSKTYEGVVRALSYELDEVFTGLDRCSSLVCGDELSDRSVVQARNRICGWSRSAGYQRN
jgi:hypothetical protein